MTHMQRISITTIDQEAADTIFSYMVNNGAYPNLPSFSTDFETYYTVTADIPVTSDNGALTNVHQIIIRYFHTLTSYTSQPA